MKTNEVAHGRAGGTEIQEHVTEFSVGLKNMFLFMSRLHVLLDLNLDC